MQHHNCKTTTTEYRMLGLARDLRYSDAHVTSLASVLSYLVRSVPVCVCSFSRASALSIAGNCVSSGWVVVARCLACLPACLLAGWLASLLSSLSFLPRGLSSDVWTYRLFVSLTCPKGETIANFSWRFSDIAATSRERPSLVSAIREGRHPATFCCLTLDEQLPYR